MIARGLPEEAINLAEKRIIQINEAFESIKTMQPTVSHKTYKTNKHSSKVTQYFFPNFNDNKKVIGAISFAVISDIK